MTEERLRHTLIPQYQQLFSKIGRLEGGVKFLVDMRADILVRFYYFLSIYLTPKRETEKAMQYRSQSLKHDFELSRRQLIEKGFGGLHACCVGKKIIVYELISCRNID